MGFRIQRGLVDTSAAGLSLGGFVYCFTSNVWNRYNVGLGLVDFVFYTWAL